jgi:hypothetical protein
MTDGLLRYKNIRSLITHKSSCAPACSVCSMLTTASASQVATDVANELPTDLKDTSAHQPTWVSCLKAAKVG